MMRLESEAELRQLAERRAGARFGFYSHAMIYVVVNTGLAILNVLTSPHYLWCVWPLVGWGIGLAAHGLAVFTELSGLRERAVEREMERLRGR